MLRHPKIAVVYDTVVERFEGDGAGALQRAWLRTAGEETARGLEVAAAFVAIGHAPHTAMLEGSGVALTPQGYVDMSGSGRSSRTSVDGVFAAGDVADPTYRQAVTSAGSGAQAALDVERWLGEQ